MASTSPASPIAFTASAPIPKAEGGKDRYLSDLKTQDAVIRNIEVIGQAVKDFGVPELESRESTVPWKLVAGMRDFLAHRVIERDLDPLLAAVERIAFVLGVHLPAGPQADA